MTSLATQLRLQRWQRTAERAVKKARWARKLRKAAEELAPGERYALSWDPHAERIYLYDSGQLPKLAGALRQVTGLEVVQEHKEAEVDPSREVLVKEAVNPLRLMGYVSRAVGGPNPVSDAIAGALTLGTLGYGAGWLGEMLFPKRYVRRGKLRKTLMRGGALLGSAPFLVHGLINAMYGDKGPLEAFVTPYSEVKMPKDVQEKMKDYSAARGNYVEKQTMPKRASYTPEIIGRPIPVQQFQQAIWNDVANYTQAPGGPYTPPTAGAVASSIVSDIQQRYGGRSVLSPRHFIRGLLASGADLVTSRVVGGVLSALGGLTPEAQQKLQDMGVWGGMMRGMLGSFGTPGPVSGSTRMVR